MKINERHIPITLDPQDETEYRGLLQDYFAAAERMSRGSSAVDIKQILAIKEKMSELCNRNPQKIHMLKQLLRDIGAAGEKAVLITKSSAVAADLYDTLNGDADLKSVLRIDGQLSVHQVNAVVDRFNKSPGAVALIVTDALNPGLDLTAANHLIHCDYPIRYADLMLRNHRITRQSSYHEEATIHYLTTTGKIDEYEFRECMAEKESITGIKSTV